MSHIPLEGTGHSVQTKVMSNTHVAGALWAPAAQDRWAVARSDQCPGYAGSACLLWNLGETAELWGSGSSGSAWCCGDKAEAQKPGQKLWGAQLHPSEGASSPNLGDALHASSQWHTDRQTQLQEDPNLGKGSTAAAPPGDAGQGMDRRDKQRNHDAACALTHRPAVPAQGAASPRTLFFYGKEMRRGGPGPALAAVQDGFKPERKQPV